VELVTCPEAETRVGTAGVGGEKMERDREGTAESNVDRPEAGGGGCERAAEYRARGGAWKGAGGGTRTGRGSGMGAVKGVLDMTKVGAATGGGVGG